MDIDILLRISASCSSLFLMMLIVGSTGPDINSAFTSYEVMHSPSPGVFNLFDVSYVVGRMAYQGSKNPSKFLCLLICDCISAGHYGSREVSFLWILDNP